MQWSYRSPMLAHEFCTIDADIVCLQEVQNDHYDNFYKFIFKAGLFFFQLYIYIFIKILKAFKQILR